ncbi:restriction system-associated AAA family ATPase [Aliirhizobium terrae]|uniref:restriction system-associated AAA family ATPase n=1 Tax=Terrirhizobium terrae TaxID=2926709 RepID=UPI0025788CCF|nr:restriction system-associated AAA family ATPase [Rhizobium sp. CC-CFT758]WJH42122.1 restriction system-associated AAA family ATPase [Rhizobium sp. CC-CFT758]
MRLHRIKIDSAAAGGGVFDGLDVWFGREEESSSALAPMCLIGPNGSGKSQFLQIVAEIFQAAWNAHSPSEERSSANQEIAFEVSYSIRSDGGDHEEIVTLRRARKGKGLSGIELFRTGHVKPLLSSSAEFGRYLPSVVVGYTSGDNETLSSPFLVSRSGYANDVARAALKATGEQNLPDNRLMLIDYGTNLEVLFANLMLGKSSAREEILRHAGLSDLASCRCIVRLAHSAVSKAPARQKKVTGRKGIQLTEELERTIDALKRIATCWTEDNKTETYTFDFFIDAATRDAFSHFWPDALSLYKALHKLALLNDLAIPRTARKRFERAVKERRFASRLPEPQQEHVVFGFEEVRFWPAGSRTTPVDYVSLSDGEHQQALILGTYAMISEPNALFLWDEPESHFNPQWRVKFVQRLQELTGNRNRQELLLTSHAPFVPSDMPREQVLIFDRKDGKIFVEEPSIETFGATFDRILETCFKVRPSISKIAEKRIEELLNSSKIEEVQQGLNELGPSVEKAFVAEHLRKLKN